MGKIIDVGKESDAKEQQQQKGLMQLLNPTNLLKKAEQISKDMIGKSIPKKVLIEQASNGFFVTFATIEPIKKIYNNIKEVNKATELFFKRK